MRGLIKGVLLLAVVAVSGVFVALRRLVGPPRGPLAQRPAATQPRHQAAERSAQRDEQTTQKSTWLRRGLQIMALLVVLGIGGFLFAASGIMPIKASSGHWPITAWFLNFSMARSVSTHSTGIKVPPLDQPHLVLKGAAHFEIGCRPCHGSPRLHHPRIALSMTPHPPYLPPKISEWDPEELFYIVKHGVKFTGMPSWYTQQRDDEVWAVVAFLLEFPKLDENQYQRLALGAADNDAETSSLAGLSDAQDAPQAAIEKCGRCHGIDGQGRGLGAFPKLAGQKPEYLAASLKAYADGERHSGIMGPIAAGLSDQEIQTLASYYGEMDSPPAGSSLDESPEAVARGERIARDGIPEQKVPACISCHGPSDEKRNPLYPRLTGQYAKYLALQLVLFNGRHRGGTEYHDLMHHVAGNLEAEQMIDVAAYYESIGER